MSSFSVCCDVISLCVVVMSSVSVLVVVMSSISVWYVVMSSVSADSDKPTCDGESRAQVH